MATKAKKALNEFPVPAVRKENIQLVAVEGWQSNRPYWSITVPVRELAEYFRPFFERKRDRSEPLSLAQRSITGSRIFKIADYILKGLLPDKFYVIPPVTVTFKQPKGAEIIFEAWEEDEDLSLDLVDAPKLPVSGVLILDPETIFWIADGQHRIRSLIEAYLRSPLIMQNEMTTIMLVPDATGKLHQRLFLDINQAVKPSKSIINLFNQDDEYAEIARQCLISVPIFEMRTDLEGTNPKGDNLFAMSALTEANRIFAKVSGETDAQAAIAMWKAISQNHPHWQKILSGQYEAKGMRENTISFLAVSLNALALIGGHYWKEHPNNKTKWTSHLPNFNWSADNPDLEGVVKFGGQVKKNRSTEKALAALMKEICSI